MAKKQFPVIDYNHLYRVNPDPSVLLQCDDPAFTIIEQNDAHASLTATRREDIIGKSMFESFPDTSEKFLTTGVSDLLESFRTVVRTRQPDNMQALRYDLRDPDGTMRIRYWQATHYPIFDASGAVAYIRQITHDVTESLTKADRLEELEQRLAEALEIGRVGSWVWDIPADKVIADKNLSKLFGVEASEGAAGLPLEIFTNSIHPDDRARVQAAITETIKTSGHFEQEYRTVSKEGVTRWVIARGRIEAGKNKQAVSFPGVIVDITERKLAQLELEDSLASFRNLADSMPQLVWIARPDGYHEYYNQPWYDYTGTTLGSAKGNGWSDACHPDDQERSWKTWQHSLQTGEPYAIEYRLKSAKTNTYRWFVGRALPVRDSNGVIQRWYGTCTDIDDQMHENERLEQRVKRRTRQLEILNANLASSNQELQDFAYVASHDLQEPLRKIQAFANLLESEYKDQLGEGTDYLERMKNAAGRMSALITDLLSFSRVTTKARPFEPVDLPDIVRGVLGDLETRIAETGATITVKELPTVSGDAMQMRQLFQNLVGNALKFKQADTAPHITVSSTPKLGKDGTIKKYVLEVADNGIGFEEKYLDRIFTVFQRLHGRSEYQGTGIGLAICRKIVERHHGTITATSVINQGSTFIITLPAVAPRKR